MPPEVISYMLSDKSEKKRLYFQFVLQCAPFLKGLKLTCIMNIKVQLIAELKKIVEGTRICYQILVVREDNCLVFFYRRAEFEHYLMQRDIGKFLHKYGYENGGVDKILQQLSARVCRFSRDRVGFPHEIGVFLAYPLEDVKGFIECRGMNSLLTGYWKVYTNAERARLTFLAYDKAKASAVNEYLIGKPIHQIARDMCGS